MFRRNFVMTAIGALFAMLMFYSPRAKAAQTASKVQWLQVDGNLGRIRVDDEHGNHAILTDAILSIRQPIIWDDDYAGGCGRAYAICGILTGIVVDQSKIPVGSQLNGRWQPNRQRLKIRGTDAKSMEAVRAMLSSQCMNRAEVYNRSDSGKRIDIHFQDRIDEQGVDG